ncbi:hypothetical protein QQ020_03020 [Fulvivirgaceae bacterium BMA12]|uniref:Uncharacterized protein n=1 Tax=Agaribacillus aureus TaxID=3051825 RepID=A0ABT8KZT7_9BACT|nr:hypothetical protein [Fulvivirgaceae bacterium BMA12]
MRSVYLGISQGVGLPPCVVLRSQGCRYYVAAQGISRHNRMQVKLWHGTFDMAPDKSKNPVNNLGNDQSHD